MHAISQRKRPLNMCILYTITIISLFFFSWLYFLKLLRLANLVLFQYYRDIYINLNRKVKVVMQLVDLYRPYVFFTGW